MNKVRLVFVVLILMFCFIQKISSQANLGYADSIRVIYNIPELSYAVINAKQVFEMAAMGRHSFYLPDTASLNDRFHIGSNTKAMTAFMIAKYVEKGKLQWSTKFFDVFPEWKGESKLGYANITLMQLLSHRAGIHTLQGEEDDPVLPTFQGTSLEKRRQFGRYILQLDRLTLDSQQTFIYSNAGYTLATLMVEKITQKSWEQLMDEVFNKDLQLNIQYSWPENQRQKDTWGHLFENNQLNPVASDTDFHLDYTEPAGDLNIKLTDYIKFIQMNLEGLLGKNNYLSATTYATLHKGLKEYALGWYNVQENGVDYSSHSGTVGTYYTTVQIDRTRGVAYIIFTNSFNDDTQKGTRALMRKLKDHHQKL